MTLDFASLTLDLSNGFYFLDLPSLLLVLPVAVFFGISATSWRSFGRCWTYTLGSAKQVSISDANSVARCLKVMGDVSLIMGIIGTFIGVIFSLNYLQQGANLAPAIGIAVVTLFYGFLFKLLSYVAEQRVRNLYLN